ncbi:MAG: DNA repair protein RecO [Firmicutes bacterium]|nr:DNA repair protein RecO [Bacillota bacterium]
MYTETEGIILKQIKTTGGRRMILLLTEKYGMISAGTSIPEKGRNKSSLALRPFTMGRYELYKGRDSFSINGAETVKSFYSIGEDIDKYMAASYVLELTEKMVPEDEASPRMYELLKSFLELIADRKTEFDTPVIAYQIKALAASGLALSQNPLLSGASDDKINIVRYIEQHPMSGLKSLSVSEELRIPLESQIKQYIFDNLGIGNLKSETFRI